MSAETTVGSLIGFLRLDLTQWKASVAEAKADARELGAKSPDIHIHTNASEVIMELAAVDAAADNLDEHTKIRVKGERRYAQESMGYWWWIRTAIASVVPTLGPLIAGTAALAAGFGALATVAVPAFMGLKDKTSETGRAIRVVLQDAKDAFKRLSDATSERIFDPVADSIERVTVFVGNHMGTFRDWASLLGRIGETTLQGLLSALSALEPLVRTGTMEILRMAEGFRDMAQGQGLRTFVDYARAVLPQVMATVGELIGAVASLLGAFTPLGMTTLRTIEVVSNALNALPLPVLQLLASGATAVYLAVQSWRIVGGIVDDVGKGLHKLGLAQEKVASTTKWLGFAANGLIAVLGIMSFAWSLHQQKVMENEVAVHRMTDALIESNGAITDSIVQAKAKELADAGVFDKASKLGLAYEDVTRAALGNADAQAKVNAQLAEAENKSLALHHAGKLLPYSAMTGDINAVKDALHVSNTQLDESRKKQEQYADATKNTSSGLKSVEDATKNVALALIDGTTATDQVRKSFDDLNNSLDRTLGRQLALSGAQTSVARAILDMKESFEKNGLSMDLNTEKGIKNRENIERTVGQLLAQRKAMIDNGTSISDATIAYDKNSASLLDQMGKLYGTKSAAYLYAQQLLTIPRDVTTTINANTGAAAFNIEALKAKLAELTVARTVGIIVKATYTQSVRAMNQYARMDAAIPNADGGIHRYAAGGIENHVAQIGRAGVPIRYWAEPETGGEAYIPLSPTKRSTSVPILAETNQLMGDPLGVNRSGPVEIRGTLTTPWGPAVVEGVIADALAEYDRTRIVRSL